MVAGLVLIAAGLEAQGVVVSGRVLLGAAETPLASHWAVLHHVGPAAGGPIDSVRTDPAGRYLLRIAELDTEAVYFVSADFGGIGYFSSPVRLDGGPRSEVAPLVVYDTTSTGPPIGLERRLVTVGLPATSGAREVLELLELSNGGTRTRITPDSVQPVWTGALPAASQEFLVGESDMSPRAVLRVANRLTVHAPIPPGRPQQLTYQYYLPAGMRTLALPIDPTPAEFNLLLEDTAAAVSGATLQSVGTQVVEGRHFAGFRAGSLAAGTVVTVAFSAQPFRAERLVPWIAGAAALALLVALAVALRRGRADERPPRVTRRPLRAPAGRR